MSDKPPVTAVWIDQDITRVNPEFATSTPPEAVSGGLGELLDRLDKFVARPAATVLLGGSVPGQLGFRGSRPPALGEQTGTYALNSAAKHGWKITKEQPWMVARRTETIGKRTYERVINIGVSPWLDVKTFPLLAPGDPVLTLWRMYEWTRMLGIPYFGSQVGLAGMQIIADRCTLKRIPRWQPTNWEEIEPAHKATEHPFRWESPAPHNPGPWHHQFDVTVQYMSAMNNVYVAVDALRRTPVPELATKGNPVGYYRVIIPQAWNLGMQLPHPAGQVERGVPVWVTHPTLDILAQCADQGIMEAPEILECWSSPTKARVFREFGETMALAIREASTYAEDPQMFKAVKQIYKSTVGLLERPGGRIYRPDWAHAIRAQARTELWRKMHREGMKHRYTPPRSDITLTGSGRWPVEVEADAVWYSSDTDQPNWPTTFLQGDGLTGGTFVVKKSRKAA